MRIRTIKPSFFTDDRLAECAPLARLLFQGLWCVADCEGRLADRPKSLKAQILPFDDCDVDALLNQLAERGFIVRYQVDAKAFIEVPGFREHQRLSGVEAAAVSKIPGRYLEAPEKQSRSSGEASEKQSRSSREAPEKHSRSGREATEKQSRSTREAVENAGREGKGKEENTPLPPSRGDVRVPVVVEPELPLVEPEPEPDELAVDDHAPELDRLAQLDAQAPASASRQRWLVAVVAAWNLGAGHSGVARAQDPSNATAKRDEVMLRWRKTFPRPSSWGAMARALARSDHHRGATTGWRADLGWVVERGRGQKLERFMAEGAELLALGEASGALPPAIEGPAVERAAKVSAKASAFDQARALAAPSSGTLRYRDTSAPYRRAAVDDAALFVDDVLSSAELAPIDPLEVAP